MIFLNCLVKIPWKPVFLTIKYYTLSLALPSSRLLLEENASEWWVSFLSKLQERLLFLMLSDTPLNITMWFKFTRILYASLKTISVFLISGNRRPYEMWSYSYKKMFYLESSLFFILPWSRERKLRTTSSIRFNTNKRIKLKMIFRKKIF